MTGFEVYVYSLLVAVPAGVLVQRIVARRNRVERLKQHRQEISQAMMRLHDEYLSGAPCDKCWLWSGSIFEPTEAEQAFLCTAEDLP